MKSSANQKYEVLSKLEKQQDLVEKDVEQLVELLSVKELQRRIFELLKTSNQKSMFVLLGLLMEKIHFSNSDYDLEKEILVYLVESVDVYHQCEKIFRPVAEFLSIMEVYEDLLGFYEDEAKAVKKYTNFYYKLIFDIRTSEKNQYAHDIFHMYLSGLLRCEKFDRFFSVLKNDNDIIEVQYSPEWGNICEDFSFLYEGNQAIIRRVFLEAESLSDEYASLLFELLIFMKTENVIPPLLEFVEKNPELHRENVSELMNSLWENSWRIVPFSKDIVEFLKDSLKHDCIERSYLASFFLSLEGDKSYLPLIKDVYERDLDKTEKRWQHLFSRLEKE